MVSWSTLPVGLRSLRLSLRTYRYLAHRLPTTLCHRLLASPNRILDILSDLCCAVTLCACCYQQTASSWCGLFTARLQLKQPMWFIIALVTTCAFQGATAVHSAPTGKNAPFFRMTRLAGRSHQRCTRLFEARIKSICWKRPHPVLCEYKEG